jgi:hypothetical protein
LITGLYGQTGYTGPIVPQGHTGYNCSIGSQEYTRYTDSIGPQGRTGQGFSIQGTNYGNILCWNGSTFTSSLGKVSVGDYSGQIN